MKLIFLIFFSLSSFSKAKEKIVVIDSGVSNRKEFKDIESINLTKESEFDIDGHGSHLFGIFFQDDFYKKYDIISIKALDSKGNFLNYLNSLKKAIDLNPKAINISMTHFDENMIEKAFLRVAASKGIKIFVAAGNLSKNLNLENVYPCSYAKELKNLICVGSKNNDGKLSSFSNYGDFIVYDKGEDIIGFGLKEDELAIQSGTSQATINYLKNNVLLDN